MIRLSLIIRLVCLVLLTACSNREPATDAGACGLARPQVCGPDDAGVCCLSPGQESCVVGVNGPICCSNDGMHETCGATNGSVGDDCCDLSRSKCATNYVLAASAFKEACCPLEHLCNAGICCNAGTVCDPNQHTCVCPDGGTC